MKIKVCGMVQESNITDLIQLDINYIGFIFYPKSVRQITHNLELIGLDLLPSNLKKIGVFVNQSLELICEKNEVFHFDLIQLHGDESVEFCQQLKAKIPVQVIKAFQIDQDFDFNSPVPFVKFVDYFLFDTASENYGGTGQSFDWKLLEKYDLEKPFFLSGGINDGNLEKIKTFNHTQFHAIDINSKFEIAPGLKDITRIKNFITKLNSNEN
jgi:phosphoribosylanthranilate isomerase